MVVGILFEVGRIDRQRAEQHVVFKQRQRRHRAILDSRLGIDVGEIKTRMKLIYRTAVSKCKAGDAFTQRDASRRQLLRVFTDYVTCARKTFAVVVDVNTASVEWDHVAHFIDKDLECVCDVKRSSKRARDLVERINLAVRFLDLIVGDDGTALACLGYVNGAQLNRRLGRVVRRLMLESEFGDFFVKTWQVLEKLLDYDGIEVNSRTAKQQRSGLVHRHAATERSILTNRVETIDH